MSAKRDESGRLLCKRRGCLEIRSSDRECTEHAAMTSATFYANVSRRESHSAPWRRRDTWGRP